MKIKSLKLVNFRNYENVELEFKDKLNIIYGNNGSGKTNLVEAIYSLAITKSFRNSDDKNLIKKGELSTCIEGVVSDKNTETSYHVIISKDGKKVKIDNDCVSKISNYISNIKVILLEPDEHTIFSASPQIRRKLLNVEISKLEREYIIYLNSYNKVLKQRNFYLRNLNINGNASYDYLNILTKKLIDYGLKVHEFRREFIENINAYIGNSYIDIFKSGDLKIKYNSDFNNKTSEDLFNHYKKNYQKEIILGKTLFGVHHDDLVFSLDGKNISEWGSNGQQKNAIFAFKLAEIKVILEKTMSSPILILDDLFSALDNEKAQNIIRLLNQDIQTFITTTDLEKIDSSLTENAALFEVNAGVIREV